MENKVVIIAGATGGIGKRTCEMLAREGAWIVAVARDQKGLLRLKEELNYDERRIVFLSLNLRRYHDLGMVAETPARGHHPGRFSRKQRTEAFRGTLLRHKIRFARFLSLPPRRTPQHRNRGQPRLPRLRRDGDAAPRIEERSIDDGLRSKAPRTGRCCEGDTPAHPKTIPGNSSAGANEIRRIRDEPLSVVLYGRVSLTQPRGRGAVEELPERICPGARHRNDEGYP